MGTSKTARKFVDKCRKYFKNVALVNAENESSGRESFIRMARVLNITHSPDISGHALSELVYKHVSRHVKSPTLFILDNANRLKVEGNIFGAFNYSSDRKFSNVFSHLTIGRMDGSTVLCG